MCEHCMSRRKFGALATAGVAGVAGGMASLSSVLSDDSLAKDAWDPDQPSVVTGRPLLVQPVLAYQVMRPFPATSTATVLPTGRPPAASTAARAAATSATLNARWPKPGRLTAVAGLSSWQS